MTQRKDWDTYFMDIAYMASTRSQCGRRHVARCWCRAKKLLGSAYNGAPMGVPDCLEAGCMIAEEFEIVHRGGHEEIVKKQRCIRTIHAEQNLLLFLPTERTAKALSSMSPISCWTCANMLANSGIREIVYHRPYLKDNDKVMA